MLVAPCQNFTHARILACVKLSVKAIGRLGGVDDHLVRSLHGINEFYATKSGDARKSTMTTRFLHVKFFF